MLCLVIEKKNLFLEKMNSHFSTHLVIITLFNLPFLDEHRPIVHPFTCAKNRFHVTSLDCRILPSLTSILIDLMFYSK